MRRMRSWMVVGALVAVVLAACDTNFYFYVDCPVGSDGGTDAGAFGGGGYSAGCDGGSDE
jgi:hypothetical protein